MIRAALLCSILLVGGCADKGSAGGCPAKKPQTGEACSVATAPGCNYSDAYCDCYQAHWSCSDPSCATASPGAACASPGQRCILGFENEFECVGPEHVWVFCGAGPYCGNNTTGQLCCGPSPCPNSSCMCGLDGHVKCPDADGGT